MLQSSNIILKTQKEKESLLYLPIFLLTVYALPSFMVFQVSFSYHFLTIWRTSFSHSFRLTNSLSFLVTDSFSFSSSENILISPYFWKYFFPGIRFWVDSTFLPSLERYFATSFQHPWFLMRNLLHSNCFVPVSL